MTIKVRIMGNINTKNGAKHIDEVQEFTENDEDILSEKSFVDYITYMLRNKVDFIGLCYQIKD